MAPGLYQGFYRDPDTNERVDDESYKFIVAVLPGALDQLREVLRRVCVDFAQKCIYLNIAGQVEFIEGRDHAANGSL